MGKDLRGKELGVGISQRKDGTYTGRFTTRAGKRIQKYFKKLQECRQWLADAQFQDEHGNVLQGENPTVDAWYQYWIANIKGDNILNYSQVSRHKNIKNFQGAVYGCCSQYRSSASSGVSMASVAWGRLEL